MERRHMRLWKKPLDFSGNPDHVRLGLTSQLHAYEGCHCNNFADYGHTSVSLILDGVDWIKGKTLALAEVCALLSAILVYLCDSMQESSKTCGRIQIKFSGSIVWDKKEVFRLWLPQGGAPCVFDMEINQGEKRICRGRPLPQPTGTGLPGITVLDCIALL